MVATPDPVVPPTTTTPLSSDPPCQPQAPAETSPRSFKKHKVLPRPSADVASESFHAPSDPSNGCVIASHPNKEPVTPPRSTRGLQDTGVIGPDPPPTPPVHLRTLSGNHSLASSPLTFETPLQAAPATGTVTPIPGTPTLQRSPPTPDVTPPQVGRRLKGFRPTSNDRIPSKGTTDSRSESFKTARESPVISDEEKATPKSVVSAARRSYNATGRQIGSKSTRQTDAMFTLGMGSRDTPTPRGKQEFFTFDGDWASNSEVEQEWDDYLNRNVTVRKHRGRPRQVEQAGVLEDATNTPTKAAKAPRPMRVYDRKHAGPLPQPLSLDYSNKGKSRWGPASLSESALNTDLRRSSGMSTKSNISTVVEAILVDVPPQKPKTLRHVKKQTTLRDSSSEFSPSSSTSNSLRQIDNSRRLLPPGNPAAPRTNSMVSVGTVNSIASRKARRQIWKSGAIPVVVIPERKGSTRSTSTGPPSLRSRDSHHTKRSNSLGSESRLAHQTVKKPPSSRDKPPRAGRPVSMTYGDTLTLDYPPIVPRRTSSLSAPTSRNNSRSGSRTGSLTTESLKAHNALLQQEKINPFQIMMVEPALLTENTNSPLEHQQVCRDVSAESHDNEVSNQKPLVDHNGDPFFGKRLTAYHTPFSQVSVETNGTHSAADIAEAMAVNIYSHQNKSVLMVHHVSKPVNHSNDGKLVDSAQTHPAPGPQDGISGNPEFKASGLGIGPVTPLQSRLSVNDGNSPLRNPRAPPEPPTLNLIPATPSGMTTASEKKRTMGNFFEETQPRPSLVRRAFSLRKNTNETSSRMSGLLARTLSLSKTVRKDAGEFHDLEDNERPIDESRLHPEWYPAYDEDMDIDDHVYDVTEANRRDDRNNLPSNIRPTPRRGSLSERMRRAFAILPIEDDNHYTTADDHRSPERRTIRRTPSGNLRVVPQLDENDSAHQNGLLSREGGERPSTAPENSSRRFWGGEKRYDDRGRRVFPGWQDKLEQYKPQNLQRRLSEHRRQKRTEVLRQKISGPCEVRDGSGDIITRPSYGGPSYQAGLQEHTSTNCH